MIPLKFLQLPRSSFSGNLITYPSLQSSGTSSSTPILYICSCLIAILFSVLVNVPLSTSRSSAAGTISGGFCEAGLLGNSSEHSAYLFRCCSSPTICLSTFTGLSGVLNFSASFLVVSHRPFIFRTLSTCAAASASPSMYFLFSLICSDALLGVLVSN